MSTPRHTKSDERPPARSDQNGGPSRASIVARAGAAAAIIAAVVVIVVLVFGSGNAYTISADFQNASGLVNGDNVLIGPATVGTISSIAPDRSRSARSS